MQKTKYTLMAHTMPTCNKVFSLLNGARLNIKIPVPTMALQEQFAAFVEQIDKSKVAVQKALDEAQTLFDCLMQEYFG